MRLEVASFETKNINQAKIHFRVLSMKEGAAPSRRVSLKTDKKRRLKSAVGETSERGEG